MKILILTLLLAAIQAVPQSTRKDVNANTPAPANVQDQGQDNKATTLPMSIQSKSKEDAKGSDRNSQGQSQTTTQHPIWAFVCIAKALASALSLIFTGLLVLVGFVTCGVIAWQSWETRRAAEATLRYAKAFIESQRAQLAISFNYPIQTTPFKIPIKVKNAGLTPAYSCIVETWLEIVPHPFNDFTIAATYHKLTAPMMIYPNVPQETMIEVWLDRNVEPDELSEIYSGGKDICFRIHVEYRDAFRKCRWQEFGFFAIKGAMAHLPKYNDSGEC